jgi:hypothetical protein
VLSVMMSPGAIVLTRIPASPSSSASDLMNAFSAALATLWALAPGGGYCDTPLEMATTQPLPCSSICGRTALTQ